MSHHASDPTFGRSNPWLRAVIVVIVLGLAIYNAWQRQRNEGQVARPNIPITEQPFPTAPEKTNEPDERHRTIVANQTIRDQDGHVVFRGDVDVGPTLDRISRNERLEFSHDGIVFQNRERRLPQKPAGYYHEYVHLTPGISGPGPQRIIVGRDGETYYTSDHYRTFQRLNE